MDVKTQLAELNKELSLTSDHDRDEEGKKEFVDTQLTEIRAVMWRLRVDIILNQSIEAANEEEQAGLDAKVREMKADLRRMKQAIDTLLKVQAAL